MSMHFSDPNERDELETLRETGPDPSDYSGDNGIDWDRYEKDYDTWADDVGFPN